MNNKINNQDISLDERFQEALKLFNMGEWYPAHDSFEELWHETYGPERNSLQGLLQIAVAQVHLEKGNINGATILYGEGLGRLKKEDTPDFGLDFQELCLLLEARLKALQHKKNINLYKVPSLRKKVLEV